MEIDLSGLDSNWRSCMGSAMSRGGMVSWLIWLVDGRLRGEVQKIFWSDRRIIGPNNTDWVRKPHA